MSESNAHIAGKYAIIVALIGLIGTFGSQLLEVSFNGQKNPGQELDLGSEDTSEKGLISKRVYRINTGIGIALRNRPLTEAETEEINRCRREGVASNWRKRIDEETQPVDLKDGSKVIYYETRNGWYYIEDIITGKKGYIARLFGEKSSLKE